MISELHPSVPVLLAAVLCPFVGMWGRRILSILAPALGLCCLVMLPENARFTLDLLGHDWQFLHADMLGKLFALAFLSYGIIAAIFAWTDTRRGSAAASLLLVAGGTGVVLAGDLFAMFVFWEMLSVGSFFLVWMGTDRDAHGAGLRYAFFHTAGGMSLLAGALLLGGDTSLRELPLDNPAAWLIFFGVITNAAVPPLHAWLVDAYPRASIYGTVFLAAFTTKSAVCILIRLFPGADILTWMGVIMALYGVTFAVLENNTRRLLGYHIISQVGFMVTGVGLGSALALNGSAAHAFCHIFYKGLLMMSAGAVIYATGRGSLHQLGGLAKPLKAVMILCIIGAFSISGMPLFNGFISKSMVISAASYEHAGLAELLLTLVSTGTFLSIGCKLVWFTYFAKPEDGAISIERPVHVSMYIAMALCAAICIITGIFPGLVYDLLPYRPAPGAYIYKPFTADHFVTALELLIGTALGFWLLLPTFKTYPMITLDLDRLYRRSLPKVVDTAGGLTEDLGRFFTAYERMATDRLQGSINTVRGILRHSTTGFRLALILLLLALLGLGMLFQTALAAR